MQSILHPGSGHPALASLPNLNELLHPPAVTNGLVYPGYTTQPAPLGLTDYGLGATPYSYNTSHIDGSVTFNAPPNVTQPSATNVISGSAAAERLGYVGSEYEFGIQLNTVGANLTIPGTNNTDMGEVWAQNVVNWNDTGIHLIQDTWNASYLSFASWQYNSIYSGCGGNTAWANDILFVYGVFQCSEGNIPVTSSDYPVTLSLYNNFSVNAQNRAQLVYGYSLYEAGAGKTISGIADTVVFNNTAGGWQNPTAPPYKPGNIIDPFQPMPHDGLGEQQDAEIDIVGGIEGDNGVFTQINGSVSLQYSNASSGDWQNVPSAYNYGSDTGETSMGIADYWTPSHTLMINQGPSMLYGLWNAVPEASVHSGDIQISGTVSPSYGFVFVSNTPGVNNPWTGGQRDNMSWLPSSSTGAFNTYLPPLGAPWTSTYYVQGFAPAASEENYTVTGSTTSLAVSLPSAPGQLRAPIYMSTATQAGDLAHALGAASTAAPYVFNGLTVDANFTFSHVNDWLFPSFEIFQSQGVSNVQVSDVYQGTDSASSGPSYIWAIGVGLTAPHPGPAQSGFFVPAPLTFTDTAGYISGINIFFGSDDSVNGQSLVEVRDLDNTTIGVFGTLGDPGWQLTLWGDTDAWVNDTLSGSVFTGEEYPGIWVGNSLDTLVTNTTTDDGSVGVTDIGSTGTTVTWLWAYDESVGIEAYGAFDSTYDWINASTAFFAGAIGFEIGQDYGAETLYQSIYYTPGVTGLTVSNVNVTQDSFGGNISLSSSVTLNNVGVWDPIDFASEGFTLDSVNGFTLNGLVATNASGFFAWNVSNAVFNNVVLTGLGDYYANSVIEASTNVVFNDPVITSIGFGLEPEDGWFVAYGIGIVAEFDTGVTVNDGWVSGVPAYNIYQLYGIGTEDVTNFAGNNLNSTYGIYSYELEYGLGTTTINGINALNDGVGVDVYYTSGAVVTNVMAMDSVAYAGDFGGVGFWSSSDGSVTTVSATDAVGVNFYEGANHDTASQVTATDDGVGVVIDESSYDSVTGVTATMGAVGVDVDPASEWNTVSHVSAANDAVGVIVEDSEWTTATAVTATNASIGVWSEGSDWTTASGLTVTNSSVAVFSEDSDYTTITGVTASNQTLVDLFTGPNPFGLRAVAAIVTQDDDWDSISNVVATTYPAAIYDYYSYVPGVHNVNATGSNYGIYDYETDGGVYADLGMYQDTIGFSLWFAEGNVVTGSSFVDCSSYGVATYDGDENYIYDNSFIGNNGAGSTYSAAHIQAYSGYGTDDYFYFEGVGNYWSDWHTYTQEGNLAPYPLGDLSWDYYPLGGPEGTFGVWFYEEGITSGASWSVTFNGATQSTSNGWAVFYVLPGTYSYSVGAVSGYTVTPASGSLSVSSSAVSVDLTYTQTPQMYTVNVTELGLAKNTAWSATVNGVTVKSTANTSAFSVAPGTYDYQIVPVAGYTASPSMGTLTVVNGDYNLYVTFTQVTYEVTVTESGLASGTSWSASVNGNTQTSTGAAITFALPNGTYSVTVASVSGYSLSSSSVSVSVVGTSAGASVSFTPNTTTSVVSTNTFNTWLAVAIAIAVIALVLGLLALFLRRRSASPPSQGAQAWTPPAQGGTEAGGSAGSSGWSEGPPAGGSPPSS